MLSADDHPTSRAGICSFARPLPPHRRNSPSPVFERTFKDFGLEVMRTDGAICVGPRVVRLSKLSVWWVALAIQIERLERQVRRDGR